MSVAGNEDNDRPGPRAAHRDPTPDNAPPVVADPAIGPRPGPDPIEADTWGEPTATVYAGRHHTASSPRKLRLAIGAGLAGLVAAVAIPLLLTGSPSPAPPSGAGEPDLADGGSPASASDSGRGLGTGPSPTAVPTSRPETATAKPTPRAAPFTPLTFEAEAGGPTVTLGGSAWVSGYAGASNGKVVRNLGDWHMRGGAGTLRLNGVTFPTAGTYVLSISFVHPDNEPTRTAQVTVSGEKPVTATFAGTSRCCNVKKITVEVAAGTHTITISNSRDQAPSIDKIVISRA